MPLKEVCFSSGSNIHKLALKQFNRSCTSFQHSNLPKIACFIQAWSECVYLFPSSVQEFQIRFFFVYGHNKTKPVTLSSLSCLVFTRSKPSDGFFLGLFLLADHCMAAGILSCSCGFDLYPLPFLLDACSAADVRTGPSSVTLDQNMWAEYLAWKAKGAASLWGLDQKRSFPMFCHLMH